MVSRKRDPQVQLIQFSKSLSRPLSSMLDRYFSFLYPSRGRKLTASSGNLFPFSRLLLSFNLFFFPLFLCLTGCVSCCRVRLFVPHGLYVACQAHLSMEFYRQEYWSGFPFPTPGDLSSPGTEPMSPVSPALAGGFFTTEPPEKSKKKWACPGFESRTSHNRGEDHTRRLASPTSQFRIPMVGSP